MASPTEEVLEIHDLPDFSLLPDVIWVNILRRLDLPTRGNVSQTCHALYGAFQHPSLWHTVKMSLIGGQEQHVPGRQNLILPERYIGMTQRFGAYYQNLTIKVVGFVDRFPLAISRLIMELAERCRLQTLTLDIGVLLSKGAFGQNVPRKVHLDELVMLVRKAFRLKRFYLKSWPLYRGIQKVDILESLKSNPKLQSLERLDLFWQSAEEGSWATLNAILPSPEATLGMVTHFNNLQYLALRSTMLRQDIVLELAKRGHTPLKKLAVLLTYSRYFEQESVPEISSSAWKSLHDHSPELEVEISVVTRVPFIELAGFLKPEIPVSTLGFMKYSSLRVEDLDSIRDKYSQTLCKFVSLVEVNDMDESLKALVQMSPKLICLVFHGSLYRQTVLDLAAIRGPAWYRFDLPETAINFSNPSSMDELDEDVIVVKTADGKFELADVLRASAEDDEQVMEQSLLDLIAQVSHLIGQKWRPL